jgi:hypothetical protein
MGYAVWGKLFNHGSRNAGRMDTDGESRNSVVLVVVLVLVIEAGEIEDEDENENEDENLRRQPAEAKRGAHGVTRPTTVSKCFLAIMLNFFR